MIGRHSYSDEEMQWWKEILEKSNFGCRGGIGRFLKWKEYQVNLKVYEFYGTFKNKDVYYVPPQVTVDNWFIRIRAEKIYQDWGCKKKKNRKYRFPDIDALVRDSINISHDYLSDYGLGVSWTVVLTQANKFATELKYCGITTHQEYNYFQAITGWVAVLKKRNNLNTTKI